MTAFRPLRVVVAGSSFGQFYAEAVRRRPAEFVLVAVLGRGSARSVRLAERHRVPLVDDPADLPPVDLAAVVLRSTALGGVGSELARELLASRVPVLQEQPVHHDDLAESLRVACRHGVAFGVGDLYPQLAPVRRFVAAARASAAPAPPLHLDGAAASQVSFPLMHVVADVLGGRVRPARWHSPDGGAPFTGVAGSLGSVGVSLRLHTEIDPTDPDNHLPLLHQLRLTSPAGTLTLVDTHGPVVWAPRLHLPAAVTVDGDLHGPGTAHLAEPASAVLGPDGPGTMREVLADEWPEAIARDLDVMAAAIRRGGPDRRSQYLLAVAELWHQVTATVGLPRTVPGATHRPLPPEALADAVAAVEPGSAPGGGTRP